MNKFLLTYNCDGYNCYIWFEEEQEMDIFIAQRGEDIEVTERIHVLDATFC